MYVRLFTSQRWYGCCILMAVSAPKCGSYVMGVASVVGVGLRHVCVCLHPTSLVAGTASDIVRAATQVGGCKNGMGGGVFRSVLGDGVAVTCDALYTSLPVCWPMVRGCRTRLAVWTRAKGRELTLSG